MRATPLIQSTWLSRVAGGEVWLKLESLQPTGAYKIRGAANKLLKDDAGSGGSKGSRGSTSSAGCIGSGSRGSAGSGGSAHHVVTASAGNHGRAVAYVARQLGMQVTVFVPRTAPQTKRDAVRALGATLRETATYDEAEREAKAYAASIGVAFLSPYNDPDIVAGAGTIGLEILEELPDVDAIVVPVGGGGLISGIASAARAIARAMQIVGVEVEASHPFHSSLRAGRIVEIDVQPTLADGLAGNLDPDSITFEMVQRLVDDTVMVSEDQLAAAIRGLAEHEHLIVEGAGAVGVAALMSGCVDAKGRRAAIVISGSNIDLTTFRELLA